MNPRREIVTKSAKRVAIAGATLILGGLAPVVPNDLSMDYAYQYEVTDQVLEVEIGTTTESSTLPVRAVDQFTDSDGNGVISVAVFTDSDGNEVRVQIPDGRYAAMGRKGGYAQNPMNTEYRSVFETLGNVNRANAAIARDTTKTLVFNSTAATSVTFSHDGGSGTDRLTAVPVQSVDLNRPVSTVTYNGASMIEIAEVQRGGVNRYLSLWYLAGSDTGTNNVVVSFSGGTSRSVVGAVTLTGVDQTTPLDDADSFNDTTADGTSEFAFTASVAGTWAIGFIGINSGGAASDDVDGNTTQISEFDIYMFIEPNPAPVTSAGAVAIGVTHPSSSSGGVAGLFAPAAGGGGGGGRRIILVE